MAAVKSTRKYSSPVRDEQAARTRRRILDAAAECFLELGYARTTVQQIADRAGVARDTVHAVFGGKAGVLNALIDTRVVPDDTVADVTQRPDAQAVKDETDQRRQLTLFADFIAGISTGLRPVYEILRTAAAVEPDMAEVLGDQSRSRLGHMQTYARWIAARGPLRVPTRRAGQIMWALASPDLARLLCDELGWTQAQHARWLEDTLAQTLLRDPG